MRFHWVIVVAALLGFFGAANDATAQRRNLSIGDPAPGLNIEHWMHGEATSLERGKVYVIEFWATWCVPCVQAIPKLSEMQRLYRDNDLVIIGISTEEEETVRNFVQRRGREIEYHIAVDSRKSTHRSWMRAAERDGVPSAFIVGRKGKVQFIGNPYDSDFSQVLTAVLNGRYDAKLFEQAKPMLEAAKRARDLRNWNQATRYYNQVLDLDARVFALVSLDIYEMLLVDMNAEDEADEFARKLLQQYSDDGGFLVHFARKVATDPAISDEKRDMDLAMKAANRAGQVLGSSHPDGLAVRAEINYLLGNYEKAVTFQRRAWMFANPQHKARFERRLNAYRDAQSRSQAHGR